MSKRKAVHLTTAPPRTQSTQQSHFDYSPLKQKEMSDGYKGFTINTAKSTSGPVIQRIDVTTLHPELFYERYIKTRTPVILTNLSNPNSEFKALKNWSNSYLNKRAGQATLQIEHRETTTVHFGKDIPRKPIKFAFFLDQLSKGSELYYLTSQTSNYEGNELPDLVAEPLVSLQGDFPIRPKIMGNLIPYQMNLWMGNTKNGSSSGLHHDYHDNLYVLQRGCKVFNIFAPSDAPYLSLGGRLNKVHANGLIVYQSSPTINPVCAPALDFFYFCYKFKQHLHQWEKLCQIVVKYGIHGGSTKRNLHEGLTSPSQSSQIDLLLTHTLPDSFLALISKIETLESDPKSSKQERSNRIRQLLQTDRLPLPLLYSNLLPTQCSTSTSPQSTTPRSDPKNSLNSSTPILPLSTLTPHHLQSTLHRIEMWKRALSQQNDYLVRLYKFSKSDRINMERNDTLFQFISPTSKLSLHSKSETKATSQSEGKSKRQCNPLNDDHDDTSSGDDDSFSGAWGQAGSGDNDDGFADGFEDDFDAFVKKTKGDDAVEDCEELFADLGSDDDGFGDFDFPPKSKRGLKQHLFDNLDDDYEALLSNRGKNKRNTSSSTPNTSLKATSTSTASKSNSSQSSLKSDSKSSKDEEIFPHFTRIPQSILYQHQPHNPPSFAEIMQSSSLNQSPPHFPSFQQLYTSLHSHILASQASAMNAAAAGAQKSQTPSTLSKPSPITGKDPQEQRIVDQMVLANKATVVLTPGEALYLPASWFHEVRSFNLPQTYQNSHDANNSKKHNNSTENNHSNQNCSTKNNSAEYGGHVALNYWFFPPSTSSETYPIGPGSKSPTTTAPPSFANPYGDNLFWQFWWARSYGKRHQLAYVPPKAKNKGG